MWEQISSNRTRSAVLVAGMGLLLLALGYAIGFYFLDNGLAGMVVAGIVWGIMSLVSMFQGDNILLAVAGARKIRKEDDPRLYNVVEEMSIAAGLGRVPDAYIINDQALNAFAIGRDPKRAAVAITAGLLAKLNRDELQGVIAHEIAHIKNRDVSLMAISAVMLGAVVLLSWYASRTLFFAGNRRNSDRGGGGTAIVAIFGLVLIILAPIFAQLLHLAISRKREYLADASSALYTRYPEGLASALEKMAGSPTQVRAANQATASMYTISPFTKQGANLNSLLSTHPPIKERIRILRAMGGNSYQSYERAYEEVLGKGKIIPRSALAQG
ncbi:MAG: M48 family metallopeptidase [Dehalococcoidia bacterium]|nr:M48 family metallopeptidase [Dehalococcoidia bacterium]